MGISWSGESYAESQRLEHRIVQLSQKLDDAMKASFSATNRLTEFLNANIPKCNLKYIQANQQDILEHNCNLLLDAVNKIQTIIEKVDRELKDRIEPRLYRELTNPKALFQDKVKSSQLVMHNVDEVVSTPAAIAVSVAIASAGMLPPMLAVTETTASSPLAAAVLSSCTTVKGKSEFTIEDLEKLTEKFIFASNNYTDCINEVLAELRVHQLRKQRVHITIAN